MKMKVNKLEIFPKLKVKVAWFGGWWCLLDVPGPNSYKAKKATHEEKVLTLFMCNGCIRNIEVEN
jgi:hypothetical protein